MEHFATDEVPCGVVQRGYADKNQSDRRSAHCCNMRISDSALIPVGSQRPFRSSIQGQGSSFSGILRRRLFILPMVLQI